MRPEDRCLQSLPSGASTGYVPEEPVPLDLLSLDLEAEVRVSGRQIIYVRRKEQIPL